LQEILNNKVLTEHQELQELDISLMVILGTQQEDMMGPIPTKAIIETYGPLIGFLMVVQFMILLVMFESM
jgi:hypothetical protein